MNDTQSFLETDKPRLVEPKDLAALVKVDPQTVDKLVDAYTGVNTTEILLTRLAEHYKVTDPNIEAMLIARQISLLHLLTDYSSTSNPGDFQKLLGSQNERLDALMKRATEQLNQLATALSQAKFMRDEAARVLAAQQMELARFDKEATS